MEFYGKRKRRDVQADLKLSKPDNTNSSTPTHKPRENTTLRPHDEFNNKVDSKLHPHDGFESKVRPQQEDIDNVTESNVRQKVPLQLAIIVRPLYDDSGLAETTQELNLESSPGATSRQISGIGECRL